MSDIKSLWGDEFNIPDTKERTRKIIQKAKCGASDAADAARQVNSKKVPIEEKIRIVTENVRRTLSKQLDSVLTIKSTSEFADYVGKAIASGVIAVDTETNNSLDPITCKLMGLCLYYPGGKQAYIPVNHIDHRTGERLPWQLTESDVMGQLRRVVDAKTFIVMHNGKFDYQVLKCTCGVEVRASWDTLIASQLINENESASLKEQYILHVDPDQEKYSISKLFDKQEYAIFPPEVFALYAATDSLMTYRLYEYQRPIMESEDFGRIRALFLNREMPCVWAIAEMELAGVELDMDYDRRLSAKYHKMLDAVTERADEELRRLKPQIDAWRLTSAANVRADGKKSKTEQLDDPVNLGSPTQLAILLYDVLGAPIVNQKKPRGTGDDEIKEIKAKTGFPICSILGDVREVTKLITTYIDKLPEVVNVDGRVHCHFNQYGAATGRLSSSDPNLQNIPSHNKEIRMLFKAKDGFTLVGSDFSQQEPRLLSFISGDENMMNSYKAGKDLYATIASGVYHNDYWDNMEHHEDGTPNPEGKKRRSACKSILLGIQYSRGAASIAEQIGSTKEEANKIISDFYRAFPNVKKAIDDSHEMAREKGYVEDLWGRRRHLPDIQLPRYVVTDTKADAYFNPFLICEGKKRESARARKCAEELSKARYRREKDAIISKAASEGLTVTDNESVIARAERQCLNARIQGSASTMTKTAMVRLFEDGELRELGFRMLIQVHDELIGECPKENAEKVAERLTHIMRTCVEDDVRVPFKCDASICDAWYLDEQSYALQEVRANLIKAGKTEDEAFSDILTDHEELTEDQLRTMLAFR